MACASVHSIRFLQQPFLIGRAPVILTSLDNSWQYDVRKTFIRSVSILRFQRDLNEGSSSSGLKMGVNLVRWLMNKISWYYTSFKICMRIMDISRILKMLRCGPHFYSRYILKKEHHSAVVTAAGSKTMEVTDKILCGCLHQVSKVASIRVL